MFAPVRCCFDVMFLLFASLFALRCVERDILHHHSLNGVLRTICAAALRFC